MTNLLGSGKKDWNIEIIFFGYRNIAEGHVAAYVMLGLFQATALLSGTFYLFAPLHLHFVIMICTLYLLIEKWGFAHAQFTKEATLPSHLQEHSHAI